MGAPADGCFIPAVNHHVRKAAGRKARNSMDAAQIVEAIKRRRDLFWDRQVLGTASDPLVYSEAELARAIADEYDSLLAEWE